MGGADLATKSDLSAAKAEINGTIASFRIEVMGRIDAVGADLNASG